MRLFIRNTLFFLIFVALLITLLQALLSFRIHGKTVRGHDNLEMTAHIDADLVFLGSSRCWAHFDPHYFDSAYQIRSVNIGVDGHSDLAMAIVRLKTYLSMNRAPKVVVCTFDPFVYAGSISNNGNFTHKDDFARYAFLPSKKEEPLVDYFGFTAYDRYVPLYALFKYKLLTDALSLKNRNGYVLYGYERHDEQWDTATYPVSGIMKTTYFKLADTAAIISSLKQLDSLCQSNTIRLVCIQTPVYKVNYDETLFTETGKLCQELNIPFIDADREDVRNNMAFFYNSYHLNRLGVDDLNDFLRKDSLFNSYLPFGKIPLSNSK